MAWATRDDLEQIALAPKGTANVPDTVIDRHLLIAKSRIQAIAPGPIDDANVPDELIAAQCEIAAYTIITGYLGRRSDETVVSLKERHDSAVMWLKALRAGTVASTKADATDAIDEGAPEVIGEPARGWITRDDDGNEVT